METQHMTKFKVLAHKSITNLLQTQTEIKIIGSRYGEKIHEDLISEHESNQTIDIGKYYILLSTNSESKINQSLNFYGGKKVNKNFFYNSHLNKYYLREAELKKLLKFN
jgi:FlaA1/EpsC-like NDP-sugar epimerase